MFATFLQLLTICYQDDQYDGVHDVSKNIVYAPISRYRVRMSGDEGSQLGLYFHLDVMLSY